MDATLVAEKREGRGKNEANRLRAGGKIPAVFYGPGKDGKAPEGVAVAVDPKAVLRILHSDSGANTLINLKLGGSETRVMRYSSTPSPFKSVASTNQLAVFHSGPAEKS